MDVASLVDDLQQEISHRPYILQLEVLDQTPHLLKVRLHIAPELFVQIYRNDQYNTTNLALVHIGRRIYGRDQLGSSWHRHSGIRPDQHDKSKAGRKIMTLAGFLDEVEAELAQRGLP